MSENTALWDILGRTDPAHTKPFMRGGGFKGTAIKPMWSYRRMTEEFGPCGLGWGVGEPTFHVQPGSDGEVLVYCTASVWYRRDDKDCRVYGVGGDKVVNKFSSGLKSDDEAFKKAFTDAVTNALKLIGVGADVHMGMFDDNKYVNDMRNEFAEEPAAKPAARKSSAALKREDVWPVFESELADTNAANLGRFALEWSRKAEADGWTQNWKDAASEEINKRRLVLRAAAAKAEADQFPGDLPSKSNAYADNFSAG